MCSGFQADFVSFFLNHVYRYELKTSLYAHIQAFKTFLLTKKIKINVSKWIHSQMTFVLCNVIRNEKKLGITDHKTQWNGWGRWQIY